MDISENIPQRQIKHLVVSGGSIWGITGFGILSQAIDCGFLNMEDIESIYATSAGSIITSMLALKIDHKTIYYYLLKRPWESIFKQNKYSFLEMYQQKGMFHKGFIEKLFLPLLHTVELSTNITLKEFYEFNHIDLHIYTTELNEFKSIDLSYQTHPDWRLIDAIYASCSVPFFFSPIIIENACYVDGALLVGYPISKCLEKVENTNEIFGISLGNHKLKDETVKYTAIDNSSNIFEIVSTVLNKTLHKKDITQYNASHVRYQIHCLQNTTLENCMNAIYNREYRDFLLSDGVARMKESCVQWFSHTIDELD